MKFIELGSDNSYIHKEYKPVEIEIRRQSVIYNTLYAPFNNFTIGEQIKAGWTFEKSFPSKIINIKEVENDFDDERTWKITIVRI